MTYRVVLYCPDTHLQYDLFTLERAGVGGGITSRIRIAHALADRGHEVILYINCPHNDLIRGVRYCHFSRMGNLDTDIFIASSSGGQLDLRSLAEFQVRARLKILMVHGVGYPRNVTPEDFDSFYVLSNYIRSVVLENLPLSPERIFVSYRGVSDDNFNNPWKRRRDPYAMVYFGHPLKGLDTAIDILRRLRQSDPRYTLHVFGGHELWGGEHKALPPEPGLINHGMTGQKRLAREIQSMNFSLNLQDIREGFGLAVAESMRAGCVVLASPVGAFPEIITNGRNGFIIPGAHTDESTRQAAAQCILEINANPAYREYVRRNAVHTPISWQTVAQTWEGHWQWWFDRSSERQNREDSLKKGCHLCGGRLLMLADGLHCVDCGHYQRSFSTSGPDCR